MLRINMKLSEVLLLRFTCDLVVHCLYFICERKFYAPMHVKITRQWKSTLSSWLNSLCSGIDGVGGDAVVPRSSMFRPGHIFYWP